MAEQYGIRAEKALASRIKGNPITSISNSELNQNIFAIYKRKFPRHSSFQTEMKNYFGIRG
jgi:hypothetical protein